MARGKNRTKNRRQAVKKAAAPSVGSHVQTQTGARPPKHDHRRKKAEKTLRDKIAGVLTLMKQLAGLTSRSELLYFVDLLHTMRTFQSGEGAQTPVQAFAFSRGFDATRFLLQYVVAFGNPSICRPHNDLAQQSILQASVRLHGLAEVRAMLPFADIRDDAKAVISEQRIAGEKQLFEYGVRLEVTAERDSKLFRGAELLERFTAEYAPVNHVFERALGLSVGDFVQISAHLLDLVRARLTEAEPRMRKLPNGDVDFLDAESILIRAECMSFDISALLGNMGSNFAKFVDLLRFDAREFDADQIHVDLIMRKPLIVFGNTLILSPELLLDSLFRFARGGLLAEHATKGEFQGAISAQFVTSIAARLEKAGYVEVARGFSLEDSSGDDLGDIDLVVRGVDGRHIAIEAKCHELPLLVSVKEQMAVMSHLERTRRWEEKVIKRREHARRTVGPAWLKNAEHIIVTKRPEILSHYSSMPVLTVEELAIWLELPRWPAFGEIYDRLYRNSRVPTPTEFEDLAQEGFVAFRMGLPGDNGRRTF